MSNTPLILLVDYDPKALRILSDLFTQSGYRVETAKDGVAALATFHERQPDLVLLEAMIPKKHGFEVCQEIKASAAGKRTPVIITTAVYKGRKYRTQAMHVHGCDEYVEKPCAPEAILEIVKRFVPPGKAAKAAAVGRGGSVSPAHTEKRGEVIPFPTGRASHSAGEFDDDVEREISSRLDEILPDTPMFDERGLTYTGAASAEEVGFLEVDADAESEGAPSAPAAPKSSPPTAPSGKSAKAQSGPRKPPQAMKADEVMKLAQGRRRQARSDAEPRPRIVATKYIVLLGIAVVVVIVSLLLGRV